MTGFPFARRAGQVSASLAPQSDENISGVHRDRAEVIPDQNDPCPHCADGVPGRQHLTGYRLRDRHDLVAVLRSSWLKRDIKLIEIAQRMGNSAPQAVSAYLLGSQGMQLTTAFRFAGALGYDLALIDQEDA